MVVGAHLEVAPVLALVTIGIHVADDGVLDLADGIGEERHRPDTDHLVHRGTERNRGAGHAGEPRAPDAARDHHGLGFDVALVRPHATHPAVFDIDGRHLGARDYAEGTHRLRLLAHQGSTPQRVDRADARRTETAEDDLFVDERHETL